MNDKIMVSGGAGFCTLLTIAFIVLKLCGVINWPWVLVLLPTIISLGTAILIILIITIIAFARYRKKRRERKK